MSFPVGVGGIEPRTWRSHDRIPKPYATHVQHTLVQREPISPPHDLPPEAPNLRGKTACATLGRQGTALL